MFKVFLSLVFIVVYIQVFGSNPDSLKNYYNKVFDSINNELINNGSFQNAVYLVEKLDYDKVSQPSFEQKIESLTQLIKFYSKSIHQAKFKHRDSLNNLTQLSIFKIINKNIQIKQKGKSFIHLSFTYNFDDPDGKQDLTNTFVSKLLITHKGNCRSLAYLYKILSDKMVARCWLALAPNHIYIRNYDKQNGWYNTELTSGTFPTDAFVAAYNYITPEAIQNSLYMDTLSNQQSIALCILDLAHSYIHRTKNYTDGFVLKCCELVLKYHSTNPEALLLKAESLKLLYLKLKNENNNEYSLTYDQMKQTYITLIKWGYRELPKESYLRLLKLKTTERHLK